jgi:hypothetical protein
MNPRIRNAIALLEIEIQCGFDQSESTLTEVDTDCSSWVAVLSTEHVIIEMGFV